MSVLQFKQLTTTERELYIPYSGEPVFDTIEKRLYMGNGATLGGKLQSNSMELPIGTSWIPTMEVVSGGGSIDSISGSYIKLNDKVAFSVYFDWIPGVYSGSGTVRFSIPTSTISKVQGYTSEADANLNSTTITTMTISGNSVPAILITIDIGELSSPYNGSCTVAGLYQI